MDKDFPLMGSREYSIKTMCTNSLFQQIYMGTQNDLENMNRL